jgi:hypothetical protein
MTAIAAGYAVVVPDYQGLGVPGPATYIAGRSEAHVALDALRAAQRVPEARLSSRAPSVVWGYSQGGSAAAWTGQLQPSYAPELNLVGVAAGGVPGDVTATVRYLERRGDIHLAVWIMMGLHHAYPELPWDSLLTPLGREKVADAETRCELPALPGSAAPGSGAAAMAGLKANDIFVTDPLSIAAWRTEIALNDAGTLAPAAPIYLYGSRNDTVLPYAVQRSAFDGFCRLGANVRWSDTLPLDHVEAAVAFVPIVFAWISARLAGLPSAGAC